MRSWIVVACAAVLLLAACSRGKVGSPAPAASVLSTALPSPPTATPSTAPSPTELSPSAARPCGVPGGAPRSVDHVIWIWMENHSAASVFGRPDAPYENKLRELCGSSSTYRAVGSPSLPNYLAATSGDTHGITDDGPPAAHPIDADNIFRQVRATGRSNRSYEESMLAPCQLSSSGRYAVKHNPAAYYADSNDLAACHDDNVPLGDTSSGALATDLGRDGLPAFAFITPDTCNDTHDCSVATGDAWLSTWLPRILESPAYRAGGSLVFVVWDEPTPMPLLVIGPTVPAGSEPAASFDHYSLLRTTEELLGLPLLAKAATAVSMRGPFSL